MKMENCPQYSVLILAWLIMVFGCTVTKPVKTGEMAYQYKQFQLATQLLEKEYDNESSDQAKARKASLLGKSWDMLEEYGEALIWYDIADQYYNTLNSSIDLAYSLKRNERYQDAQKVFEDIYNQSRDVNHLKEMRMCSTASIQKKQVENVKIESMFFNSRYSEFSPYYFEADYILFTSDRESCTGNKVYKWNDGNFSDIFVTDRDGRLEYSFDAAINTDVNEGTVCFTKDFQEIFFTRCESTESRDQYCKIYYSQRPNGFWLDPEALMFFNDQTNFGHPCLIENDSVLIFTAKPSGSNNYDLYYSVKLERGWSEAEIMPSIINTEGDEKFPRSFGDTLYFSSDGHTGYGGLDIFKTVLQDDGSWSTPENMGWPINSGADDFDLAIDPDFAKNKNIALKGLFSSSRNTGFQSDIFSFVQYVERKAEQPETEIAEEPAKKQEYEIYISGSVVENIRKNDDPNETIIETLKIKEGRIDIEANGETVFIDLDKNGRFIFKTIQEKPHIITVKTQNHLNKQIELVLPFKESLSSDTTLFVSFALEKIIYDQEIIISNIYYDFDKWDIREDAEAPLDSLSDMLRINAQLNIELGSHTDCRGEVDYNLDLSQKRAQSVMDYLSAKGINPERLNAIGYGESNPTELCECESCTEENHQANRRTTFKILKPE